MANIEATVMKLGLGVSLVIALALSGCRRAPPVNADEAMTDEEVVMVDEVSADEELISAIRGAVEAGTSPETIERDVGVPATINTTQGDDRGGIMIADFAPDPERASDLPPIHDPSWEVVYWVRSIESYNPKIVGVAWDEGGNAQVFFGEVLEP